MLTELPPRGRLQRPSPSQSRVTARVQLSHGSGGTTRPDAVTAHTTPPY